MRQSRVPRCRSLLGLFLRTAPMLNNGTGHHIHGGIFYNIGGDVNMRDLRTHHKFTLQDRSHAVPPQLPPGSTLGLEEARDKGPSRWQQVVQDDLCPTGLGLRATRLDPGSTRVVGRTENGAAAGSGHPQDADSRRRPNRSGMALNAATDDMRRSGSSSNVSFDNPLINRSPLTLETFQSDPPSQYISTAEHFSLRQNVNFFGTKTLAHRPGEMSDGKYTVFKGLCTELTCTAQTPTAEGEPRIGKGLWNGGLPSSFTHNDGYEMWRQIVPSKNLKLIYEIGSGPGYFFHAGQNKGDAVIIKVFNPGPVSKVRKHLYSTVDLSKGIIALEECRAAEGPLAEALKNNLAKSITLGFKMVYHRTFGISLGLMGADICA
ncbi:hypothetical protein DFH08DRAFT_983982 [Mycena albidolilacea]|uniref:Uncharacterized protein n=1 Tax=Mycena albidolilacea TaxID=1033008 RepID=A0AAD7AW27_9AGAR|nr:hypothetical protein DFH08DRAFT_983982 [Mycena albidolilacea]